MENIIGKVESEEPVRVIKVLRLSEQYAFDINEAAKFFHINEKKLRGLPKRFPRGDFYFYNGDKLLFKRVKMGDFLDKQREI